MKNDPLILQLIYNRLMLKIKDGYKLEVQTPETMKLFGSTKKKKKKKNRQNKEWKEITSFEVIEVVLIQCNLVDNQHQQ